MAFLGWVMTRESSSSRDEANVGSLVNYAEPTPSSQNSIHTDPTSPSSTEFANSGYGSVEIGPTVDGINFDTLWDTNIPGSDWMSALSQIDISNDLLAADSFQGLDSSMQLDQHTIAGAAHAPTLEEWFSLEDPADTLDSSTQDFGSGVEHFVRLANQETDQGEY